MSSTTVLDPEDQNNSDSTAAQTAGIHPFASALYQLGLQHGATQASGSSATQPSVYGTSNSAAAVQQQDAAYGAANPNSGVSGFTANPNLPNGQPALPGAPGYQQGAAGDNANGTMSTAQQTAQQQTNTAHENGNNGVSYSAQGNTVVANEQVDPIASPSKVASQAWQAMSPAQQAEQTATNAANIQIQDAQGVLNSIAAGKDPTTDPTTDTASAQLMAQAAAQHGQTLQDYANSLITQSKNTLQNYADQDANATFTQGLAAAGGSTAAQTAATAANSATSNNMYAATAAAGGAFSAHAAGVNAAATQGVQNGNTALAQATDNVNNANNQLTYTTNAINQEIQSHTISANAAINQMNDSLSSISQQLSNTQGQDALNLKTQADSLNNQLTTLQNAYAAKKIDDSDFWSSFKTITAAIATVAGVATAQPELVAGGIAVGAS